MAKTSHTKAKRKVRAGNYVLQKRGYYVAEHDRSEWGDVSGNHKDTEAAKEAITEPGEYRVIVETWRDTVAEQVEKRLVFGSLNGDEGDKSDGKED